MVAFPVQLIDFVPGPKYSIIEFVPPETVRMEVKYRIISLAEHQPLSSPVRCTPIRLGNKTSQSKPAITSDASIPPTPIAIMPKPPALGVCESVPIISPPGNA